MEEILGIETEEVDLRSVQQGVAMAIYLGECPVSIQISIEHIQGATKHTESMKLALKMYRVNGVQNVQGTLYVSKNNLRRNSYATV